MDEKKYIDCTDLTLEQYDKFLKNKLNTFYDIKGRIIEYSNLEFNIHDIKDDFFEKHLFDYQKFIINLALKKQRYAIFADCGLGKTVIFLSWIKKIKQFVPDKKIIIISPLCVIRQTLNEEKKFYSTTEINDIHKVKIEDWINDDNNDIGITNYEKFHSVINFKNKIGAVVLDESSILKNNFGKIRIALTDSFRDVPFKLCCTATPAPNDRQEYANHSTFLQYTRSNNEFFAKFFVNDGKDWIIKPHSLKYFYKELSDWSIFLRSPEKYNFENNIKNVPTPKFIIKNIDWTDEQNKLINTGFFNDSKDYFTKKQFYLKMSKGLYNLNNKIVYVDNNKITEIIKIINDNITKQIIIWCTYNDEEKYLLKKLSQYNIINITGETKEDDRLQILNDFQNGKYKIIISKVKILGFGMNFHYVPIQIFSGFTDSYEQFYQAVRRSYRYGATEQLKVFLPVTSAEKKILQNVLSKKDVFEEDAIKQEDVFVKNLNNELKKFRGEKMNDVKIDKKTITDKKINEKYQLYLGDSIKVLDAFEKNSIDFSVFSPPFASLFTYTDKINDMGNNREGTDEFKLHMDFFLKRLYDVMKCGRNVCCHIQQLSTYKGLDGFVGTKDFRGLIIESFQNTGFNFFGEFVIQKNPQAQAIRNKVRSLSFAQLERSRIGSRPGYNDFVLIFKKPGEYNIDINDETGPSREEWIQWANGVWTDIKESDTLNVKGSKSEDDVKHICPLQLEVIRRCIRLYTNKGETVLDPFNGIGSTGVVSLELGRKYIGIELKEEWFNESILNLNNIEFVKLEKKNIKYDLKKLNHSTKNNTKLDDF